MNGTFTRGTTKMRIGRPTWNSTSAGIRVSGQLMTKDCNRLVVPIEPRGMFYRFS
jgi:hypothetical protein